MFSNVHLWLVSLVFMSYNKMSQDAMAGRLLDLWRCFKCLEEAHPLTHASLYRNTHNSCGEISYGRGWLTEMAHSSL